MIVLKSMDPREIAAEMLRIEMGGQSTPIEINGISHTISAVAGTIYIPLESDPNEIAGILSKVLEEMDEGLPPPITVARTPFTTTLRDSTNYLRRHFDIGSAGASLARFRWFIKYHDSAFLLRLGTHQQFITENLAAIFCDPWDIYTISGRDLRPAVGKLRGAALITAHQLHIVPNSTQELSPVLLALDEFWAGRCNVAVLSPAELAIPAAFPANAPIADVVDLGGTTRSGREYCACCTGKLAGTVYFLTGSKSFPNLLICSLCALFDASTTGFYKIYRCEHPTDITAIIPHDDREEFLRECAAGVQDIDIHGVPCKLIGTKYMYVGESHVLYSDIYRHPLLEGRKNVHIHYH